ncbi:MAG: VOC family protein [Cypionkella sp.]
MFLYITLGTNNLPRAKTFYQAVMPTLGLALRHEDAEEIGYGAPDGRIQFWVGPPYNKEPATTANGSMPAFEAKTRAAVDAFHAAGLAAGGTDEGKPGLRRYGEHFYACYLRDPDGHKLSAVCEIAP